MSKVWINPAFKDKVPQTIKESDNKTRARTFSKDRKGPDRKGRDGRDGRDRKKGKPFPVQTPLDPVLELKFLQNLKDKEIPIETELIDGTKFSGKIKWFSEWSIALELEGKESEVIFNRLQMIYYSQLKENSLPEKEIEAMEAPEVGKAEISALQKFKDEKIPLLFHLKNNIEIKGILDWMEKLIYHVKSLDGEKEYNLYKSSVIYIERMISQ